MTPDANTIQEFFLDVGHGHSLYIHDWGAKSSRLPVIFLHGGPGNGCDNRDKKKFDPAAHRVIYFDQRGAGKSTPTGSLENNTTQHLVSDIDKIAEKLDLKKFVLVGGSWGSTLALAYAIENPDRVAAIVIDGVFTATKAENQWLNEGDWRKFFPDIWEQYINSIPSKHKGNPSEYFYKQVLGNNQESAKQAAYSFNAMELGILKLDDKFTPDEYDKFDPNPTKIEIHYLANNCFLSEGHILKNASKLSMPVFIVQGRYDLVCPPDTAYGLHKILPNSKLVWTINGHLRQHEAANVQKLFIDKAVGAE